MFKVSEMCFDSITGLRLICHYKSNTASSISIGLFFYSDFSRSIIPISFNLDSPISPQPNQDRPVIV